MVQSFSCSVPCYERVLFVLFQAKADKGFSRKPPFCCAESSNTVTSYISRMTRCFLYLRLLHRGQGSPQPSAPLNWQKKKKKATQLTISLKARGEMEEGIPAIKCCSCSTDILKKQTTFLSGTHIKSSFTLQVSYVLVEKNN